MVGETWDDDSVIEELFKSGIDSQFAFKFATSSGAIFENIMTQNGNGLAKKVMNYDKKMTEANANQINTVFLSNHDQVRIGNTLEPKGLEYQKFAASVYMLYPGNPFIYYGEEIGLTAENTTNDAAYRGAMVFDTENMPEIFVNGIGDVHEEPTYGGVKQQLEDSNSLLNHYRRIIKIKNQNPAIARGRMTELVDFGDNNISAYYIEYNDEKLMVVHNFNAENPKEITITDDMIKNAKICADLRVDDSGKHIALKDGKIVLPAHSTVIIKSAE
jgi:alpha-amylase